MVWIALAVGLVLALVVYTSISFLRWSSAQLQRHRVRRVSRRTAQQADTNVEPQTQRSHRDAALRVVDAIMQEMGTRRTDVVWTITNSALWDVAVPSSKRFFTALTVWDDHHLRWGTAELVAASAELKVLWAAALDTATRIGINHLSPDDQPKADTAIKLVRKATSTPSDAERHQLMAKAAQVLSGIMSITIPRETMREIERGADPSALPRNSDEPPTAQPQ